MSVDSATEWTDAAILARLRPDGAASDAERESAFAVLMERYRGPVFGAAYRYLGNAEDAADVTQDVFVSVFRRIGGFRGEASLKTWIFRIAVNTALNALRGRRRRRADRTESFEAMREEGTADQVEARANPGPDAVDRLAEAELNAALQEKLMELPEGYRMTFILREMRDLSYEEIAEATGVPVGTVRSRLHSARARLRELLRPYIETDARAKP